MEAEKLVRTFAERHPTAIYRPSIVVGSSKTGETTTFQGFYQALLFYRRLFARKLIVLLPADPNTPLDLVPVDYVVDALFALIGSPQSLGGCFHLTSGPGNTCTTDEILKMLAEFTGVKQPPYVSKRAYERVLRPHPQDRSLLGQPGRRGPQGRDLHAVRVVEPDLRQSAHQRGPRGIGDRDAPRSLVLREAPRVSGEGAQDSRDGTRASGLPAMVTGVMPRWLRFASAVALLECACAGSGPPVRPATSALPSAPAVDASPRSAPSSDDDALARVTTVHGGAGPWVVAGYRMGEYALARLGLQRQSFDLEVVHHTPQEVQFSCIADGAAAATGASAGKLNLRLVDATEADVATTYRRRSTGQAITLRPARAFIARFRDVPRDQLAAAGRAVLALPDGDVFEELPASPPP